MQYDPIKKKLGKIFGSSVFLRKLFYRLLDILLLRSWHIHKEIRKFYKYNKKPVNATVLDAGCGFGQYSYFMAKNHPRWKIESVDIKEEEIEDCDRFFKNAGLKNVCFKVADLVTFSKPQTYDLIISVDVMEHIEEDETVFKNFYNSLKNNGILLISTPSDVGGSGVHDHDDDSFIDEHVRDGYGKNEITNKLLNAGFNSIDVYYSYGKFGNIAWHLSMKYPLLMAKYKILLPVILLYYIIVMPFCLVLNYIDTNINNKTGTGIIVKALKKNNKINNL